MRINNNVYNLADGFKKLTPTEQLEFCKEFNLAEVLPSKIFERTSLVVTAPAQKWDKPMKIKEVIPTILKSKNDGGLFDNINPYIADWDYDGNPTYQETTEISMVVDKFLKNLKHAKIQDEQKRLEIFLPINIIQASLLANELVKSGYIKYTIYNNYIAEVIIYCSETKGNLPVWLGVNVNGLNNICVSVEEGYLQKYYAGVGVLSSNVTK